MRRKSTNALQNPENMTASKVRAIVNRYLEDDRESIRQYFILLDFLKKQDGKPMGKRFETALKAHCPELIPRLDGRYGMQHIETDGPDGTHRSYMIAYTSRSNDFSLATFLDCHGDGKGGLCTCHYEGAVERNAKREKALGDDTCVKLAKMVRKTARAMNELEKWLQENRIKFPESTCFDLDKFDGK